MTLAQLMEANPRHPWEVVLDMTHTLDAITQEFRADVLAGEALTVDQLDRLIQLSQTTHHLATTAINTKAADNVAMAFTRHLELEGQLVGRAVGAAIDKLGLTEPWRTYAFEVARWTLAGEDDHARGDEPQPPTEPVVQEYDVRPASWVPAIEAAPVPVLPCDVTVLDDAALVEHGERLADELERRGIDA